LFPFRFSLRHPFMGCFYIRAIFPPASLEIRMAWRPDTGNPIALFLKATGQAEGDLHLSYVDWNVSKALISTISVVTSSTDWDLYLLQNDNGFVADDAAIPKIMVMRSGEGDANIYLSLPYEDEDASNEVHLYYLDNSGTNTVDIYIRGTELI